MPAITFTRHPNAELTREDFTAIANLMLPIWPNANPVAEWVAQFVAWQTRHPIDYPTVTRPAVRDLAWDGEQLIGHAFTFERPIFSAGIEISVLALSGVCVAEPYRRQGLGVTLVQQAFQRVDSGEFEVSLFQTGVPYFYEKLGARVVTNRFFNSRSATNPQAYPWQEATAMIYPASYPWPTRPIDINGAAF